MKIAFLFPGQGAQYVGMGKELYDEFPVIQQLMDQVQLDFDLKKLCFEGPEDVLAQTKYTQPSLVATEIALATLLNQMGIYADVCAGLSLGEYAALAYAKAMDSQTAIELVYKRGKLMEAAVPAGVGSMAAIIGLDEVTLQQVCQEASTKGVVEIANYNCPGQLVIGGHKEAVEHASSLAVERGARRAIPLNVSGPFHTSLLKEAGEKLREELNQIPFEPLQTPIIFNATGNYEDRPLRDLLEQQIQTSVYFEKTIRQMLDDQVDTFIEIGPSKTLSGLIKKIDRKAKVFNVEDLASLNKLKEALGK